MKKQNLNFGNLNMITLFIMLMTFFPMIAFGQNNNIKVNVSTSSPLGFSYERVINHNSTVTLGFEANKKKYKGFFEDMEYTNNRKSLIGEYRIYLGQKEKLNGIYIAPNISFGSHNVNYYDEKGLDRDPLLSTFILLFDILDGDIDGRYVGDNPEPVYGNAKINTGSLGFKVGYQKRFNAITLDMGFNLSKNSILGNQKELGLSNGTSISYENDIDGFETALYLGVGYAF